MNKHFALIIFGLLICFNISIAQDTTDSIDPATVTDGPYISWQDDSTLQIDYVCYGEHHEKTVFIDSIADIPEGCFPGLPGGLQVSREPVIQKQSRYNNVSKIMAISDIHGEYQAMLEFLQTTKLIDSKLNWIWGAGHLVIDGDVFDRGPNVTQILWLLYRLQHQAEKAGGAVHYQLGNHELMVLRGDDRYLNDKYTQVTIPVVGSAHQDLVGPKTIIGQWLRTCSVITVIDSILFVHGGVSLDLVHTGLTIDEINKAAIQFIDIPKAAVKADSLGNLLQGRMGPFWYRGLLIEHDYPQITRPELDTVLNYFGALAIVVGHSEQDSLVNMFDNKLFGIDVPVHELGGFQGLLIQNKNFYRVKTDGTQVVLKGSE